MIVGSHARPAAVVNGVIHPSDWIRPAGNHEPRLVRGFIPGVHDGIDISFGRVGDPILAAAPGKVIFNGRDPQGSLYVVLDHTNPFRTLYGHMNDESVANGQTKAGQVEIGHVGYSGHTVPEGPPGAHLHFEIFLDDTTRINPWPLLWQNVRIKPKTSGGIRLRTAPLLSAATIYAETTAAGRIVRAKDHLVLGLTDEWRRWDGIAAGASYPSPSGGTSTRWERIWLDGRWVYIASDLSVRSAH